MILLGLSFQDSLSKMDMGRVGELSGEAESIVQRHNLQGIDLTSISLPEDGNNNSEPSDSQIPPSMPPYFKIAKVRGVNEQQKLIQLDINPKCLPTSVCGDGCAVNVKGSRLLEEKYGIDSPFSRCASHTSSGTIRRLCTSVHMSQPDAKALYESLRSVLKHFSMSPKSSEFLNQALENLEMNDVHLLNWGSTRMAGFLDACIRASSIIVPFIDVMVNANICSDASMVLLSPKGMQS